VLRKYGVTAGANRSSLQRSGGLANCHNFSQKDQSYPFIVTNSMASIISDSIKTVARHYKEKNLNWPMIIYIGLAHVAALFGIYSIPSCNKYTLLWAFILWPISGLGITGGVHRLWAHRSYKATPALRMFLMLVNSIANQGSIWHWSRDHRVHHKYSEVNGFVWRLLL
jgi:fatty-acid desaturase